MIEQIRCCFHIFRLEPELDCSIRFKRNPWFSIVSNDVVLWRDIIVSSCWTYYYLYTHINIFGETLWTNFFRISSSNSFFGSLSPLNLYYQSTSSQIFLYGLFCILTVWLFENTCQIITFSCKAMRNVSTGVFFLALSIFDTMFLLLSTHNLIIHCFQVPDRSDYSRTSYFDILSTHSH